MQKLELRSIDSRRLTQQGHVRMQAVVRREESEPNFIELFVRVDHQQQISDQISPHCQHAVA